jgi:acyl carrier protein
MKSESQVRAELRQFVVDNFLMGDATALLEDSESLMDTGVIDSTGMLEIVMFLEQHFELKIKDRELVPENLDSVNNLVQFVLRKQSAA